MGRCLLCLVKVEPKTDWTCEVGEAFSQNFNLELEKQDRGLVDESESITLTKRTTLILQRQLDVIFLLRSVLRLSPSQLSKYLKVKGDPANWIVLCGICEKLVKNVKEIFLQLQRISKKYDEAKLEIEEKIRATSLVTEVEINDDFILDECRRTVCKRKPLLKKASFRQGDLEAQQLLQRLDQRVNEAWKVLWDEAVAGDQVEAERRAQKRRPNQPEPGTSLGVEVEVEVDPFLNWDAEDDINSVSSSVSYNPSDSSNSSVFEVDNQSPNDFKSRREDGVKLSSPSKKKRKPKSSPAKSKSHKARIRKPQTCRLCKKVLQDSYALKVHLLRIHNINEGIKPLKTFTCTTEGCGKVFNNITRFNAHLEWHKEIPTCDICKKEFTSRENLDVHEFYIHKIVKPSTQHRQFFDCPKCGYRFQYEKYQISHSLACKGNAGDNQVGPNSDDKCPCPHCGKLFLGEYKLDKHLQRVHKKDFEEPQHICSMCPKKFWKPHLMELHMAKEHDVGRENYVCALCNNFFENKKQKKFHICGVPEIMCEICGKEFKDKRNLKSHMSAKHEKPADKLLPT